MLRFNVRSVLIAAAAAGSLAGASALAHDELLVGHNGLGALVTLEEFIEPLPLDQNFTGFPGMAGAPLGLANLPADEPGIFILPETVNIGFVIVSTTHGLTMWNGLTPMHDGDTYALGAPFFHYHPVWTIEDEHGLRHGPYTLVGFFRDFSGQYADSAPVFIDFAVPPPPCPGDIDGNRSVDFADITHILVHFGTEHTFADVTETLRHFGVPCP